MALSDAVEASKRTIREWFESGQAEFSESDLREILGSDSKFVLSVLAILKGEGIIEIVVNGLDQGSRARAAARMIFSRERPAPGADGGIFRITSKAWLPAESETPQADSQPPQRVMERVREILRENPGLKPDSVVTKSGMRRSDVLKAIPIVKAEINRNQE